MDSDADGGTPSDVDGTRMDGGYSLADGRNSDGRDSDGRDSDGVTTVINSILVEEVREESVGSTRYRSPFGGKKSGAKFYILDKK